MISRVKSTSGRGFTLVEVLVALGIFAVLSTGYLIATADAVRGLGRVQQKMQALWLAQDTLVEFRTLKRQDKSRFESNKVEFADQDWVLSFDQQDTEVKFLTRVTVRVATEASPKNTVVSLEGYFYEVPN